jgi:beta propeller repeat protein
MPRISPTPAPRRSFHIYSTDITDHNNKEHFFVAGFDFNQQAPAIYGTTAVWDDDFFGDRDIFVADIYEPARPIEFAISWQSSSETNPDIDGHIVVWQDDRYGNSDIFGYNLTTGQEFQITDDPCDQTHPAISSDTVVWQDNRSGNWEIYGAILDGPKVAQCAASMAGDVNSDCKVDFYDFAEMAADWLECGLEPQEACL